MSFPATEANLGRPAGDRSRLLVALIAAAVVAGLVIVALLGGFSGDPSRPVGGPAGTGSSPDAHDAAPARTFLDGYVAPDGRVIRHDQGGDTVSEGQSYAMLLAVADRDRARFTKIWQWMRNHLQQPDGSFAWRWQDGKVVDPHAAADADLDTVHALQLAAAQWRVPELKAAADRVAATTLRNSTVRVREGRLLVAGPWATGNGGAAAAINPSYLVAGEAERLADSTGQHGWRQVARATAVMDRTLLAGRSLPPDWVQLAPGDTSAADVRAAGAPDRSVEVRYGLDAPRLFFRLATSCRAADRQLAAAAPDATTVLDAPGIRSTSGAPEVTWRHPLTGVVAAAVLVARHQGPAARTALASAVSEQRKSVTYYGAAWVALGHAELRRHQLGSCAGSTS